ncbi:MAG: AAA family ATPase, partial [Akkermansia sp.]|nr:AAA family ATPase [Akkermansia sp.]
MVESPYRTEAGKNVSIIPEEAQKLSVPEFNRLALEGRIAGGNEGLVLAEDGNQNVLVGQIVTRIWPAATGDASVDKQRFERVEVPFTLEFQGDRVKQLLGPDTKFKRESGSWGGILLNLLPIVLILVILFFMFRAQSGGARGAMSFGKSRARLIAPDKNKVTFKDVAGISEAKEEVWELVEFLRNPEKFRDLGATIPRGVLMVGSPGTGKTLLARAIAGESNASFYSISGSDFVEMFVGVGASRVRDMFEQAKRTAPSLIFIDEIDAVGRQRGYGMGGGNDEREQTLNALLVEMDGFENNSNVIVIAATNRADILDPALLRPGRFDRQVVVNLPDVRGREQILQVHARKVKMAPGVGFARIARGTAGFSGAQLANLINEAALLAARKGLKEITEAELEEARDKVSWGRERRSLAINERGRRITAVHEAGHAICLLKTPHSEPLHRVTIVPRGG